MCVLWLKAEIACREGWCFDSLDQRSFFWSTLQNFAGLRSCRVRSLFAESIGCYSLLLLWKGFYVLEVVKGSSLFKVLVKQEYFVSTVQNTGWNTLLYAFSMGRLEIFLWAHLGDQHSLNLTGDIQALFRNPVAKMVDVCHVFLHLFFNIHPIKQGISTIIQSFYYLW